MKKNGSYTPQFGMKIQPTPRDKQIEKLTKQIQKIKEKKIKKIVFMKNNLEYLNPKFKKQKHHSTQHKKQLQRIQSSIKNYSDINQHNIIVNNISKINWEILKNLEV